MKAIGLIIAVAGLVSLSLWDWLLNPRLGSSYLWRPQVGVWGVLCAGLLVLSAFVFRVEETYDVRLKGAAVGLVSPILAALLGHRGFSTVMWLYLPIVLGFATSWLSRPRPLSR